MRPLPYLPTAIILLVLSQLSLTAGAKATVTGDGGKQANALSSAVECGSGSTSASNEGVSARATSGSAGQKQASTSVKEDSADNSQGASPELSIEGPKSGSRASVKVSKAAAEIKIAGGDSGDDSVAGGTKTMDEQSEKVESRSSSDAKTEPDSKIELQRQTGSDIMDQMSKLFSNPQAALALIGNPSASGNPLNVAPQLGSLDPTAQLGTVFNNFNLRTIGGAMKSVGNLFEGLELTCREGTPNCLKALGDSVSSGQALNSFTGGSGGR